MFRDKFEQRLVKEHQYVLLGAPFHERQYLLAGFDPSGGIVGIADVNGLRIPAVAHQQVIVDPELIGIKKEIVDDVRSYDLALVRIFREGRS